MGQYTIAAPDGNSKYSIVGDAPDEKPKIGLGDAIKTGVGNIPSSAMNTAESFGGAVMHPLDSLAGMGNIAGGYLGKAIPALQTEHGQQAADAFSGYVKDRYGSYDAFKRTLARDPVGVMTDVASVLEPATLARKAPGVLGKVAKVASKGAEITNPAFYAQKLWQGASLANKVTGNPVGKAASHVLGLTTGVGAKPIETAFNAGREGGVASKTFLDNMKGNVPVDHVVESAKGAVGQLKAERSKNYRSGMFDISKDRKAIDFAPIDAALSKSNKIKNFQGVDISPSTAAIREKISETISSWKNMDKDQFHTPEGMDALKQLLGDIRSETKYGSPSRAVADAAYGAVKDAIVKQAPVYARVMKDYQTASDLLQEAQDTFSIKEHTKTDTALRKLQSIMRDNVQTNYGRRGELGELLSQHGAPNLQHALAGQSLSPLAPRGIARAGAGLDALYGALHPAALAALLPASPRIVGEAAHAAGAIPRLAETPIGKAVGSGVKYAAPYGYQAGQAQNVLSQIVGSQPFIAPQ